VNNVIFRKRGPCPEILLFRRWINSVPL